MWPHGDLSQNPNQIVAKGTPPLPFPAGSTQAKDTAASPSLRAQTVYPKEQQVAISTAADFKSIAAAVDRSSEESAGVPSDYAAVRSLNKQPGSITPRQEDAKTWSMVSPRQNASAQRGVVITSWVADSSVTSGVSLASNLVAPSRPSSDHEREGTRAASVLSPRMVAIDSSARQLGHIYTHESAKITAEMTSSLQATPRTAVLLGDGRLPMLVSPRSGAMDAQSRQPTPRTADIKPASFLSPTLGALSPALGALSPRLGASSPALGALSPQIRALSPMLAALSPRVGAVDAQTPRATGELSIKPPVLTLPKVAMSEIQRRPSAENTATAPAEAEGHKLPGCVMPLDSHVVQWPAWQEALSASSRDQRSAGNLMQWPRTAVVAARKDAAAGDGATGSYSHAESSSNTGKSNGTVYTSNAYNMAAHSSARLGTSAYGATNTTSSHHAGPESTESGTQNENKTQSAQGSSSTLTHKPSQARSHSNTDDAQYIMAAAIPPRPSFAPASHVTLPASTSPEADTGSYTCAHLRLQLVLCIRLR
jgi:hypothetical protein